MKLVITLEAGSHPFSFELRCRAISVRDGLWVHHFWMDDRALRPGDATPVWRDILDLFWAVATSQHDRSPEQVQDDEEQRILAELYPAVLPRSAQYVFDDAHLGRALRLDDPEFAVDLERFAADGANVVELYREAVLDIGAKTPIQPGTQQIMEELIAMERAALRAGPEHFRTLRARVRERMKKEAKRLIRPDKEIDQKAKDFIRAFAYQVKVAFHWCYAQVWSYLLGAIEAKYPVSAETVNLLKVWHLPQENFGNSVLALHPVSAIIMGEPLLLGMLAPYLRDPASEEGRRNLTVAIALAARRMKRLKLKMTLARRRGFSVDPEHLDDVAESNSGKRQSRRPKREE